MSRFAELLNTEAFEQKKASLKSRCSFTNRAYMPSVTFLACPKKGDPKKGTLLKTPLLQARSSSVHFGNSPIDISQPLSLEGRGKKGEGA